MVSPVVPRRTRVLIVDDSSTIRQTLRRAFVGDPRFEVVGTLGSAEEVLEQIASLAPDVMTLDIEMPGMSGIELLSRLRSVHPVPTVMVSSHSMKGTRQSVEALAAGAIDVVAKPQSGVAPDSMLEELRTKLAIASLVRVGQLRPKDPPRASPGAQVGGAPVVETGPSLIAIGGSTGGPEAVQRLLTALPAKVPPIVVVLHMPAGFTRAYAARLNELCRMPVSEAVDAEVLSPGRVVIAPGGRQLRVIKAGRDRIVALGETTRVSGHAPSVDVLFESVATAVGRGAAAAILTGMGSDGALGLQTLRRAGGRALAQDEASCVVFGMPKAAWDLGAAEALVPLDLMPARLLADLPR